jgi:hypothetical protein
VSRPYDLFRLMATMEQKARTKIAHAKDHCVTSHLCNNPNNSPETSRAEIHHHGRTHDPAPAAWPWLRLFQA